MAINQSLSNGLKILNTIAEHGPELGVREVARLLSLDKSKASRLLLTLAEAGFLEQNPATRRYRIGPTTFEIGQKYTRANPLYNSCYDELHELAERESLNVYLCVRSNNVMLYLYAIQGAQPYVLRINTGVTGQLHTTAAGKVLLAAMSDEELQELLPKLSFNRLTPYTILNSRSLMADLRNVRSRGYSISDEENLVDIYAVGCPIRDASGNVVAAISSAIHKQRQEKDFFKHMQIVTERCAGIISSKQGALPSAAFGNLPRRAAAT